MPSLKRHEGYLLLDHRSMGQGVQEMATITCSHCQRIVVLNPLRVRERAYCRKCDHYICDACGAAYAATGGECKPFKQVIEEEQEKAALIIQSRST